VSIVYIKRISDIEEKIVDIEGAKDTTIQWLITKENAGAKNFAMRRFVIKPGGKIPKHHHPWEHEIYVLSGKGIVGAADKEYEVSKDMVLYIPPDIDHWYRNPFDESFIFLCIIPYKEKKS